MPVHRHADLPIAEVPRIKTRVLADTSRGATATAVWEQWIAPQGHIPLHYHHEEEILVFLAGEVQLRLGDETCDVSAPATVIVPPRELHSVSPAAGTSETVHLLAFFPVANPAIYAPDGTRRPLPWDDR